MGMEYFLVKEEEEVAYELGKCCWSSVFDYEEFDMKDKFSMSHKIYRLILQHIAPGFNKRTELDYFKGLADEIYEWGLGSKCKLMTEHVFFEYDYAIVRDRYNRGRKKRLLDMLNKLLEIRDIKYDDLNKVVSFGDKVEDLRELEEEYPELGIARYNTEEEGISVFSLIASITDVLIGKRLGIDVSHFEGYEDTDDVIIEEFMFYEEG